MFFALLKKEFFSFIRQKANIILLIIFPVVLITTLAVGLKEVMTGNNNIFGTEDEPSIVYYSIDSDKYQDGLNEFMDAIKDEVTIDFKEDNLENVKDQVDNYDAIAFLKVTDDGFDLYTSEKGDDTKSKVFKCMIDTMRNEFSTYATILEENPMAFRNLLESSIDTVIKDETKDLRNPSSAEYYTFAELGLIILYIATSVAQSTYEEKKLTTINRIRMSKINETKMVLAKGFFGICVGAIQILIVYIYSSLFLDVNWGENTLPFVAMFLGLSVFASIAGVVVGLISSKDSSITGIINTIIIFVAGLGGCYAPLFIITASPVMNTICKVSPLYWVNIATSSMVCGVQTYSMYIAIFEPIVLSAILLGIYLLYRVRKGALLDV